MSVHNLANNLNFYGYDHTTDHENDDIYLSDYSSNSSQTKTVVTAHFRNLEQSLTKYIETADAVFGCVAWLTSLPLIRAIASKKNAAIIVQKEDFLRPDIDAKGGWKEELHLGYQLIPGACRYELPPPLKCMSSSSDPTIEGVRCVGNYNRDKSPAHPRMHHKFLVFCRTTEDEDGWRTFTPYSVWTGSFNFTVNGGRSLENAVYIESNEIAKAYLKEFAAVAGLSEPLNWDDDWSSPEWRIGT